MNRHTLVALAGAVALLGGCAPRPEPGTPAWVAWQKEEAAKTAVDDLPSWYIDPPTDKAAIFAAGTATSGDLQLAIDKAVLGAKRSLADRVNSRISGKMKEYLAESGAGDVQHDVEIAITNLITEVNLAGYNVTEKKLVTTGSQYRAYVLLRYPLDVANRTMVTEVKKNDVLEGKLRASKAFQELERDIQAARPDGDLPKAD
jgi:hypothetical protein